jgi:D-sedoheptulose 7-phosphate isomerase
MMEAIEKYLSEIEQAIREISRDDVAAVVDTLEACWASGNTTFVVGNGGSASTASHMMNDLNKFTLVTGAKRFRAIALTDNVPLITAWGNDASYDDVFVEPLRNLMNDGDVVIAISGSGNSPNVLRAIEYANTRGTTIGLCGFPGGKLAALATQRVIVPAMSIGQQEDGHLIINHAVATALRARIEARLAAPPAQAFA